jgi:hypothetical protein
VTVTCRRPAPLGWAATPTAGRAVLQLGGTVGVAVGGMGVAVRVGVAVPIGVGVRVAVGTRVAVGVAAGGPIIRFSTLRTICCAATLTPWSWYGLASTFHGK